MQGKESSTEDGDGTQHPNHVGASKSLCSSCSIFWGREGSGLLLAACGVVMPSVPGTDQASLHCGACYLTLWEAQVYGNIVEVQLQGTLVQD